MDSKLNILVKTSTDYAVVGDMIEYKIIISNESEYIAENIIIKSLLLQELKFIYESVKVDYLEYKDLNIISGINIGMIMPGDSIVITFNAQLMKKLSKYISVEFITEFNWLIDNEKQLDYSTDRSSIVHVNNPGLNITKISNKKDVQLHDEIAYKISISNIGDLDLYNIIVKDELPNAMELIDGSFMINDNIVNSVDLSKGVTINKLDIKENIIIKYTTRVVSGASGGKLINKAKARYSYTLGNDVKSYKESDEVSNTVKMLISNFKQMSMSDYLNIDDKSSSIREINEINAKVKIENYSVIKTPIATSKEGQNLSGYKLIIHGSVEQVMEYVALNEDYTTNSYAFESPFSTYIILPEDFVPGTKIEILGFVEKIKVDKVNNSSFFRSGEILIIAKVICYR